jgi:hypothetical protein
LSTIGIFLDLRTCCQYAIALTSQATEAGTSANAASARTAAGAVVVDDEAQLERDALPLARRASSEPMPQVGVPLNSRSGQIRATFFWED